MASRPDGAVLGQVRRLFGGGTAAGLDEGQLLARFAERRDEAAFEALVGRFGPMVLGVCRRRLADPADVEDAFQATFLVLARRAGSIRDRDGVGPWLYGVALKVAGRARAQALRRKARERPGAGPEPAAPAAGQADGGEGRELRAALDEEVSRLPAKYREPVVLCYLEGLTHDEAALRLRCPVGTVRSRMAWARARLRDRLARRGLSPTAGAIAAALAPAVVPGSLARAALASASNIPQAEVVSAGAFALASGVIQAMSYSKFQLAGALVLVASLAVGGDIAKVGGQAAGGPQAAGGGGSGAAPGAGSRDETGGVITETVATLERQLREQSEARLAIDRRIEGLTRALASLRGEEPPDGSVLGLEAPKSGSGGGGPAGSGPRGGSGRGGMPGSGGAIGILSTGDNPPIAAGGMGMMAGGTRSGGPARVQTDSLIAVEAEGKVGAFAAGADRWTFYRPAAGVKAVVVAAGRVLALALEGERIDELAAFNAESGSWRTLALPGSVKGPVAPIVNDRMAVYLVGRRVHAFSAEADVWATLELDPDGPKPQAYMSGPFVIVEDGPALHVFDLKSGRWAESDDEPNAGGEGDGPRRR